MIGELKDSKQVLTFPADKGKVTVLMKKRIMSKLLALLDTSTYSILKSDPTRTQGDKLIHILKGLGKPLRI